MVQLNSDITVIVVEKEEYPLAITSEYKITSNKIKTYQYFKFKHATFCFIGSNSRGNQKGEYH